MLIIIINFEQYLHKNDITNTSVYNKLLIAHNSCFKKIFSCPQNTERQK